MALLTTTTGPQEAIDYLNGQFDNSVGHTHDGTADNGGLIDGVNVINTPNGDITAENTQDAIYQLASFVSLGRVHVPIRQTVLQGNVDANNQAAFLQIGTDLSVNLLASTVPLVLAFAYGFNNGYGQIDYVSSITSDQVAFWSNLPANKPFLQLYIDRNLSTGVLTGGYTERETAYGVAPSHFNTQHWYDYDNTTYMKVSNGTNWSTVQRVMVGECTTGASSVTNVVCYAIRGKYDSGWFPVTANQEYNKSCYIGRIDDLIVYGWVRTNSSSKKRLINNLSSGGSGGFSTNDAGEILAVFENSVYLRTGPGYLHPAYNTGSSGDAHYPNNGSGGEVRIIIKRGF